MMWTRGDMEAELSQLPRARRVHEDCWAFSIDDDGHKWALFAYTSPGPDGLFPYAGCSPQYVRYGGLISAEEMLAMAKDGRMPKLALRRQ